MLLKQFIKCANLRTVRWFTRVSVQMEKVPAQKSNESIKGREEVLGARMHRVTDFDKKMLVWVKRYPSVADVPAEVTVDCILSARTKARIKGCNYMIIFTVIGCILSVVLGKRQAERGDSLKKQRDEWFQDIVAQENKAKNLDK